MTQKIGWPLIQFGSCLFLCLSLPYSLGTPTGTFMAMTLFSVHQYLMYRCYLKGLELNGIATPNFWGGMRTSLFMTAGLALFYFLVFSPFSDRFYYAQSSLGNVVQAGDRFVISNQDKYLPGEVVVFNGQYQYLDTRQNLSGLVERILAREGDKVEFQEGEIRVNGQVLASEAGPLETGVTFPNSGFEVPKDSYFILFPIRTNLTLSPDWFLVPKGDIRGKIAFKYSPNWEVLP